MDGGDPESGLFIPDLEQNSETMNKGAQVRNEEKWLFEAFYLDLHGFNFGLGLCCGL